MMMMMMAGDGDEDGYDDDDDSDVVLDTDEEEEEEGRKGKAVLEPQGGLRYGQLEPLKIPPHAIFSTALYARFVPWIDPPNKPMRWSVPPRDVVLTVPNSITKPSWSHNEALNSLQPEWRAGDRTRRPRWRETLAC
eukprot:jgi/Botrbrau1/21982/Bobra.0565s0002.1